MNHVVYGDCGIERCSAVTGSGLPVYVFPRKGFQTKYAFFAVRYGGCDRRIWVNGKWKNTPAGIAHFLEHKMFDMPDYNAMDKLTAAGASPNAFTSTGMTGYLFSCIDHFMPNLQELLHYVSTPCFSPESVAKEQGIIGQEIRMGQDNPSRRVRQELLQALYAVHPIRDSIAGSVESIAQISAATLLDCYDTFYQPANMVLCCAGDIDPEAVLQLAEEAIPKTKKRRLPRRDYGNEAGLLPNAARVETPMRVSMPICMLGCKLPWQEDGRSWAKELLKADLACNLLLGEGSPLYAALYREGLINGSFYAGSFDFPKGGVCCAGGRCPRPDELLSRIVEAAGRFTLDKVALERFWRQQKAVQGNFIMALDSLDSLCHTQADGHFCGWDRMDFLELSRELQPEAVLDFLRGSFRAERLALSVVTPIE